MYKKLLIAFSLISVSAYAAVKIQFHFPDEIIEKTLQLNAMQVVHEESRVNMNYLLKSELVSQGVTEALVAFTLVITGPNGRKTTHEYPIETIPYNKIMTLKYTNYLYKIIVQAQAS